MVSNEKTQRFINVNHESDVINQNQRANAWRSRSTFAISASPIWLYGNFGFDVDFAV